MRTIFLLLMFLPTAASAFVSGIDDANTNIPPETQRRIDEAITTYYQNPSVGKVETVLDIMNNTPLLTKKTSWAPITGFLTVVFAENKAHLFDWMARNDYNTYAQNIFVAALLHNKLNETALVFAQAHQWSMMDMDKLREYYDPTDMKHLPVILPGHVDALWGAFFGSGDSIYVNEIIDAMFQDQPLAQSPAVQQEIPPHAQAETKKLAETTLRQYAPLYKPVQAALEARLIIQKDPTQKAMLSSLLAGNPVVRQKTLAVSFTAGIAALLAIMLTITVFHRQKRKMNR